LVIEKGFNFAALSTFCPLISRRRETDETFFSLSSFAAEKGWSADRHAPEPRKAQPRHGPRHSISDAFGQIAKGLRSGAGVRGFQMERRAGAKREAAATAGARELAKDAQLPFSQTVQSYEKRMGAGARTGTEGAQMGLHMPFLKAANAASTAAPQPNDSKGTRREIGTGFACFYSKLGEVPFPT
jgi:hypothetical protein